MVTDLPLGATPRFCGPRISERGPSLIRFSLMLFLAVVIVIGVVPTTTAIADRPRAALRPAALAGSEAITHPGLAVRSSIMTFVGITVVASTATATTVGGILYRVLVPNRLARISRPG